MATILEYDNYRGFLKDALEERVQRNHSYSLRAFAASIGISASHLSRTLSGKKRLSTASARQISVALDHSVSESEHFMALVELECAGDDSTRAKILRRLSKGVGSRSTTLSVEVFKAISDWHHFAILALANTRGFKTDFGWIAARLGIKPLEAKNAVSRLLSLRLLEREKRGLRPSNGANLSTGDDIASLAVRENHLQHLEKAKGALAELPLELREFQNICLTMNPADAPKAKKLIRAFIDQMSERLEADQAQEVFQLNVQFYQLTKNEKGRA